MGPGQYGEGDVFLGVSVPKQRIIAKKYQDLPFSEVEKLLISPLHEMRLTGLLILTYRFATSSLAQRKEIFDFYLAEKASVCNWDLVDATAPSLVGEYLFERPEAKPILLQLAQSEHWWERRIAIVATFAWTRRGQPQMCFWLAEELVHDSHDLMHKAIGWMLREAGKRGGRELLVAFLDEHAGTLPRTLLRSAIERFPESERQAYLQKK